MARRVLAIVTDDLHGPEPVAEIRAGEGDPEVRVVVPAVEANVFRHTLGDVDEPSRRAEERLGATLRLLRESGVEASGEVGDADPVQAVEDALVLGPADEVVIFEHAAAEARWYEDGLFERAQERIEPPLRMVVVETDGAHPDHVVEVDRAVAGTVDAGEKNVGTAYLPDLSRGDFAGMVMGVVGTIVAIVLAAAAAAGGHETGVEAAAILIAIGVALVNMAHVVGLTLFESVHYRGGFAKFFRTLALVGTPAAVIANLLILLLG